MLTIPARAAAGSVVQSLNRPLEARLPVVRPAVLQKDRVQFGQRPNTTFMIPENSLVVMLAGMLSPIAATNALANFLTTKGHTVHKLSLTGILLARDVDKTVQKLTQKNDTIRTLHIQKTLPPFIAKLKSLDIQKQQAAVMQHFNLDNTPMERTAAASFLNLLRKNPLSLQKILGRNPKRSIWRQSQQDTLSSLVKQFKKELRDTIHNNLRRGTQKQVDPQFIAKTVDGIADKLFPKSVLVAHSLGGFVSMQSLLQNNEDISLVISLVSPLNGTKMLPDVMKFVTPPIKSTKLRHSYQAVLRCIGGVFFPATKQVRKDSPLVHQIQTSQTPENTTAISLANPQDALIRAKDTTLNENHPGTLNLLIKPLPSQLARLLPDPAQQALELMPFFELLYGLAQKTPPIQGLEHHCGPTQHCDVYWPRQGDLLQQLLEGPEAISKIRRLLHPHNNNNVRKLLLELLIDQVTDHPTSKKRYEALRPDLEKITKTPLPFTDNVDKKAKSLLKKLNA